MRLFFAVIAATTIVAHGRIGAQSTRDTMVITTVSLKHLSSQEAVALLQPYVTTPGYQNSPGGGVFPVPNGHAVTIREKLSTYGRMLKMLSDYDRSPATIAFTFQLIVADNSGNRAPEIASLDSLLRSVLKYTGYKLVGVGVARTGENTQASETITGEGQKFTLSLGVADVRTSGTDASVHVRVSLARTWGANSNAPTDEPLLSTAVTLPMGQTVVLGTAALDHDRAIILTVRPQLATEQPKRKDE